MGFKIPYDTGTSKTGFGQVKIMKNYVWINKFFSKFRFWPIRWKKLRRRLPVQGIVGEKRFKRSVPLRFYNFSQYPSFFRWNGNIVYRYTCNLYIQVYTGTRYRWRIKVQWFHLDFIVFKQDTVIPSYKTISLIRPDFRCTEIVKYYQIVTLKRGHPT
jgi:hypothetical protein